MSPTSLPLVLPPVYHMPTTCLPNVFIHLLPVYQLPLLTLPHPTDLWKLVCLLSTLKSIRLLYCSFNPLNSCMSLRRHAYFPLRNESSRQISCRDVYLSSCLSVPFFSAILPACPPRVRLFRLKIFSLVSEIKLIWIRFTCVSLFHYKISLLFFCFFSLQIFRFASL